MSGRLNWRATAVRPIPDVLLATPKYTRPKSAVPWAVAVCQATKQLVNMNKKIRIYGRHQNNQILKLLDARRTYPMRIFKGGTSFSKGRNLIQGFSEDSSHFLPQEAFELLPG